jgi:hypothetical protein
MRLLAAKVESFIIADASGYSCLPRPGGLFHCGTPGEWL